MTKSTERPLGTMFATTASSTNAVEASGFIGTGLAQSLDRVEHSGKISTSEDLRHESMEGMQMKSPRISSTDGLAK